MFQLFPTATPEEVGIDSQWLMNFCKRLEEQQLPLHSALIMRHGKVCMETYYKPYTRDTLHRMFSVTKSFVSLGIGLLEAEGKLSLDDKIVDFFPEKLALPTGWLRFLPYPRHMFPARIFPTILHLHIHLAH